MFRPTICSVTALGWLFVVVVFAAANAQVLRGTTGGTTRRVLQASNSPTVTSLRLILASTDTDIGPITDNQVIYMGDYPTGTTFNIEALVSGSPKSVRFSYNSNPNYKTEGSAPYAFCGNSGPNFNPCSVLGVGSHTVTATPFPESGAGGVAGTAQTVRFAIVAGSASGPVAATTAPPKGPTPPVASPIAAPAVPPVAAPTTAPVAPPVLPAVGCKVPKLIGSWSDGTKYPIPIAESQGGIIGEDLFVISGFTEEFEKSTAACYALNLNNPSAAWRRMDDVPIPQGITHVAAVVDGLKLYMCGGFVGGHPGPHTNKCFVYDHSIAPGTGEQWKALPSLPIGRSGGGLVKSKVRNALIYGGGTERPVGGRYTDFAHTWILPLDNLSAGWKQTKDIPFKSNHMSYVTAVDRLGAEHHFFLGGQMGGQESDGNVDHNYEFDAVNEVWIERADMPFPRGHASASTRAVSCGFIIIAGTTNGTGKTKDISYYDVPSNTWTKVGDLTSGINSPVCDIDFKNGYLYCETGNVGGRFSKKIRIEV